MSKKKEPSPKPSRRRLVAVLVPVALIGFVVGLYFGLTSKPASTEVDRGDVILTTFQWNWNSVARECTETIGPAGFGYVQISPPNETITGDAWWTSYQPVSYQLDSKLGTEAELQNMIDTCNEAGVGVIADAVINHMASVDGAPGVGTAGSTFAEDDFPGIYGAQDFNECRTNISSYKVREQVQGCRLGGLQDLATGTDYVQQTLVDYMDHLIDMGVAGFRIDAAKHIPAQDLEQIKAALVDPEILWIQEVIRGPGEPITPEEYVATGKVNEFGYGRELLDDFSNNIKFLDYISLGMLPSNDAVVFVDNHDTERNGSTLSYRDEDQYLLANIFMLAWDYGQPAVYTGYQFAEHDQGAPGATDTAVPDVDCALDDWTCLQTWPEITAMVKLHNLVAGTTVTNWWDNGDNVVAFARGPGETLLADAEKPQDAAVQQGDLGSGLAFVVLNNSDTDFEAVGEMRFQTTLPPGEYCNVLVQDCQQKVSVDKDGKLEVTVPAGTALALHID